MNKKVEDLAKKKRNKELSKADGNLPEPVKSLSKDKQNMVAEGEFNLKMAIKLPGSVTGGGKAEFNFELPTWLAFGAVKKILARKNGSN